MRLQDHPELLERLAAAHALGTLRGGARRRFETLAREHPAIRAQALLWHERFAALTELQPSEPPSPALWERIAREVEWERLGAAGAAQAAAGPTPAATALLARLRRAMGLWRGAAFAGALATVVASVVAVVIGTGMGRQVAQRDLALAQRDQALTQVSQNRDALAEQLRAAPRVAYVAVLADDKAAQTLLVTIDPDRNALTVRRVGDFREGPDRSLQLWALPPGGAPQSLGVLGNAQVLRLGSAEQAARAPALAVSLEPLGGAPAGSGPTGPVLFQGRVLNTDA
jgi:anti-sigma-K factor RskA